MSADRVAIATVSDRGYLPAACCQLKSAWDHLANRRNVRFCLVLCDVGSDDRREAERFFRARGVDAEVLVPDRVDPQLIVGAYVSGDVGRQALRAANAALQATINEYLFFL